MTSMTECCMGTSNNWRTTKWFGSYDKPASQYSLCELCADKLQLVDSKCALFPLNPDQYQQINCDSITDYRISALEYNKYVVQVLSKDLTVPFLVHAPEATKRADGLFVVAMPEKAEYCVRINRLPEHNVSFTVKMKVGSEEVVINNGNPIYYSDGLVVKGFRTGSVSNFMFVANKPGVNGPFENKDPNSNIITVEIDEYQYSPRFRMPEQSYWSEDLHDRCDDMDGSFNTRGLGPKLSSAIGSAAPPPSGPVQAESLFLGRTERGSDRVEHIQTRTVDGKFNKIRGFAFTIQLIHVCNREKQLKKIAERLNQISEEQQQLLANQRKLMIDQSTLISVLPDDKKNSTALLPAAVSPPQDTSQPDQSDSNDLDDFEYISQLPPANDTHPKTS